MEDKVGDADGWGFEMVVEERARKVVKVNMVSKTRWRLKAAVVSWLAMTNPTSCMLMVKSLMVRNRR